MNKRLVCVHDHRNIIVIALILILPKRQRKFLFIGDDGMHSILVDIYGSKYLYNETHHLKKILMRIIEDKIQKNR